MTDTAELLFYRTMWAPHEAAILWTIRVATLLYVFAIAAWILRRPVAARASWTLGVALYLAHVAASFAFRYHWSHSAAYEETARQTGALFGVYWGGGLYSNYVFTALWLWDAIWLNRNPVSYAARPLWISRIVHGFLAFMFLNAVVVFPAGWIRWAGLAAAVALLGLWFRRDR